MLLKWIRRHKQEIFILGLIIVLGVSVFLFFKAFFDTDVDDFTTEILAALLGSIVTVMITMLLIRQQGTIEQAHETAVTSKTKVFERKLDLFKQFISIYVRCAADGQLDNDELAELEELALTISMFTKDVPIGAREADLGEELCRFVLQLGLFGLDTTLDESKYETYDRYLVRPGAAPGNRDLITLVYLVRLMKIELGVVEVDGEDVEAQLWDISQYEWTRRLLEYRSCQPRNGGGADK